VILNASVVNQYIVLVAMAVVATINVQQMLVSLSACTAMLSHKINLSH